MSCPTTVCAGSTRLELAQEWVAGERAEDETDASGDGMGQEGAAWALSWDDSDEALLSEAWGTGDIAGEELDAVWQCVAVDGALLEEEPDALLSQEVVDGAALAIVELAADPEYSWPSPGAPHVFTMNADTLAITEYSGPATAVAAFGGTAYFLEPERVAVQSPEAPPPTWHTRTGALDLAGGAPCNVAWVRLGQETSGAVAVTAEWGGATRNPGSHPYPVPAAPLCGAASRNCRLGDGPEGTRWTFGIGSKGLAGSAWALSELEVVIGRVVGHRR